jgi:hypothetical protein
VPRAWFWLVGLSALLSACDRGAPVTPPNADRAKAAPKTGPAPAPTGRILGVTPMGERVAVLGFLNKRNGIERDISVRPGQAIKVRDDVIVRLRACETTPPWQFDKWTGAFVQMDVRQGDGRWRRVFSGWLYKESPSLNVVEHPVYDVWPKSCVMSFPDAETSSEAVGVDSNASSADQSAGGSERSSAADSATR